MRGDGVRAGDRRLADLQTHRRWWVARGAIAQVRRDGPQTMIELTGGLTVPVGRTYLAAVRSSLQVPVS
ncbi:LytTR family transcriptional regulator DNA-binding domain-containing protein [Caulobacter segnis]|nr:LytTR family transcriptional regulator DNA-binding domain-containing protein [Caulobacter segnis]MDG2523274.1 LytTR family transcriptional regulator DNA-binding domain-containing protein [Caulobacter segnis]